MISNAQILTANHRHKMTAAISGIFWLHFSIVKLFEDVSPSLVGV